MAEADFTAERLLAEQSNKISHVVGVMSGKGGVGKSLVASLLSCALRQAGYEVGILDADVTGPSIPKMFGVTQRPDMSELGIFPVETRSGIKLISINLFLDRPGGAVIWRGPLLSKTVNQFWQDVFWGELDYLVVDLPPGTADVPLTIMQSLPLDGVVIVTSPQDLAAMVVHKAVDMCRTMKVPVLGLVENMAWLKCPNCEEIVYPFGSAKGEEIASGMGIPHLVDLRIDPELSARSDAGTIEEYTPNPLTEKLELITIGLTVAKNTKEVAFCDASEAADRQPGD